MAPGTTSSSSIPWEFGRNADSQALPIRVCILRGSERFTRTSWQVCGRRFPELLVGPAACVVQGFVEVLPLASSLRRLEVSGTIHCGCASRAKQPSLSARHSVPWCPSWACLIKDPQYLSLTDRDSPIVEPGTCHPGCPAPVGTDPYNRASYLLLLCFRCWRLG